MSGNRCGDRRPPFVIYHAFGLSRSFFSFLAGLYLLAQQHASSPQSFSDGSGFRPPTSSAPAPHTPAPVIEHSNPVSPPGSRLNLTLAGNELRYQAAVRERRTLIEKFGGPDAVAFPEPHTASYTLWDLYGPAFSCPFPVYRVGTMGDGGKWVCGLERATHHPNCVIYSMGVERQSSFEQEVLRQSKDCQVYGFDFSVSQWGPELLADTEVNDRAHFFPYKIGAVDNHEVTPKQYSLQGIMKELGHDFIDIWKVCAPPCPIHPPIDIEGSEFAALSAVIESFKGKPLPFGQMQIEIHLNFGPDYVKTIGAFDKVRLVGFFLFLFQIQSLSELTTRINPSQWWTMLEDAGLRPFWTELNLLDVNVIRRGPFVGEWSFINIRGRHPLVDDRLPDYP
ncbi:Methyltranfer-dom domain-containing protein [Mycena venus]|uniref:Methyltranfer-dom domain-containing protein n=1 Tax=Mycena venus TaxID=2733690 RepID=A0A8H6X6K3_9AGAR|nr:Methyltranfer-dom domain-containing protein [Mycena venus]